MEQKRFLITTKGYTSTATCNWLEDYCNNDFSFGYSGIKFTGTEADKDAVCDNMIKNGDKIIDIYRFNDKTQQYE